MKFQNIDFSTDDITFDASFDDIFSNPTNDDAFQMSRYLFDYLGSELGPLLSSGMCTKVFQFDASSSAPEAIVPVTNSRDISMELHRNRRILNRPLVSLSRSSHNISEEQIGTNGK
uniref:Transcription factor hy5 n=1 Tax=Solanum tuberosum TaxID=4113 RepID=M1DSP0_SOLTU